MSTRANVHFKGWNQVRANVYRHCDGYPSGLGKDLQKFLRDVKKHSPNDPRFGDPEHLAAKFIVWQTLQYAKDFKEHPLEVLGVSPTVEDHGDIAYTYIVDCDQCDSKGFPKIMLDMGTGKPITLKKALLLEKQDYG